MRLQVDFQIINENSEQGLFNFLGQFLQTGLVKKQKFFVYMQSQTQAHSLDEYLWQFKPESFIPHNLYGEGPYPSPPVQIGWQDAIKTQQSHLINCSTAVPDFFNQFKTIHELIINDDSQIEQARKKYRYYKTNGCQLSYQDHRTHERA